MNTLNKHCNGVKCMVKDCQNLSSHKIGEENISHDMTQPFHNMTSYVCEKHFDLVMKREEKYVKDIRFEIDQKYIRYELDIRKYSSNCIKGIYIHVDEKGKSHEKSQLIAGSFLNKNEGDKYADLFVQYLNSLL